MLNEMRSALLCWLVVAWTMAITVSRAIRLPNDFAEAHWLLDYRFGFIKRGLIGTLCTKVTELFGVTMSPNLIVVAAVATFLVLYGLLLWIAWRMLRHHRGDNSAPLVLLVVATSPFLVMNAHLFGYFDAINYALALCVVGLALRGWYWSAALLAVVAILCHESFLLVGFPLLCLTIVARGIVVNGNTFSFRVLLPLLLPGFAFVAIAVIQSRTVDQLVLREQLTTYLSSYDFIPTRSASVARWHTTGFFEYFQKQRIYLVRRLLEPELLAALGPSLMALLYFSHRAMRVRPFTYLSLLLLGAVLVPLAMHAVAWDTARISSYVVGGAFIAAWITFEIRPDATMSSLPLLAVPAILLNLFTRYPLMDGEVERYTHGTRLVLYAPALVLLVWLLRRAPRDSNAGQVACDDSIAREEELDAPGNASAGAIS